MKIKETETFLKFKTPGPKPEGVGWDKKSFWIIDSETKLIQEISKDKGNLLHSFEIKMENPRCITWDGENFWFSENKNKTINKIDLKEEQIVSSIIAPIPSGKGEISLEGLAWDGNTLWSACYAGWSSKLYQIDPKSEETKLSMLCGCNPRGIASNGKYIWTICYNGKKFPSVIDRREIFNDLDKIAKSRKFLFSIPKIKNPNDLVFNGKKLVILDRNSKAIHSLEVE